MKRGSRNGAVMRALASHQCDLGSTPGPDVIRGLSLFLVLVFAPRGFSPGIPVFSSPQKPAFLNSNSIRTQWTRSRLVDVPLLIPILFYFKMNLQCLRKVYNFIGIRHTHMKLSPYSGVLWCNIQDVKSNKIYCAYTLVW